MPHPPHSRPRRSHRAAWRRSALALTAVAVPLLTSGCDAGQLIERGWLVGTDHTTTQSRNIRDLWVGSWVAALVVGVMVWGLTIYCVVHFRRRRNDTGLPPQLRYNLPLEVLYTLVPLFMVGVLFFYTARDQTAIEKHYTRPAVNIQVIGKRWSWDFNYTDAKVYDTGVQARTNANGVIETGIPVLYLPVDEPAELTLNSRDVNHSFYVPAFDYKKDVIPGRTNFMSVTPTQRGTFIGRCAELCGEYHSQMLFKVKVVTRAQYQAHLAALRREGQVGALSADLGPSKVNPRLTDDQNGTETNGQSEGGS